MCGIAGIIHFQEGEFEPAHAAAMSASLAHRGPDDLGFLFWSKGLPPRLSREPHFTGKTNAVFIHRRLSILDLFPTGWQPMGNQRHYIIFNGEIYNYLELREELAALGHIFHSRSDTEVLLEAFSEWGTEAFAKLVGMFALAILDTEKSQLYLVRDFTGMKPLYYTSWGNAFAFASEIQTLLKLPGAGKKINLQTAYDYLARGSVDENCDTFFEGVRRIPAGHFMKIPLDSPREAIPVAYWNPFPARTSDLPFNQAAEQLRELFTQSVRIHLRSDVPLGCTLSGGIDSSSILMTMRALQGREFELHAFSYAAAEDPAINEERWLTLAAGEANAVLHKTRAGASDLAGDLDRLIMAQGEPFGTTNIYAQHKIYEMVREAGIKVVLGGQGADELFGGYRYLVAARLASLLRQHEWRKSIKLFPEASTLPGIRWPRLLAVAMAHSIPAGMARAARRWILPTQTPAWINRRWFLEHGIKETPREPVGNTHVLKAFMLQGLTRTSLPSLLRYEDRNSMAFSVESRLPFLTPQIAEFVLALPEEYIIDEKGISKSVFRKAMEGIVPAPILARKDKIGFATPERAWLGAMLPAIGKILAGPAARAIPFLNLKALQNAQAPGLWRALNFIRWSELFNLQAADSCPE